MARKLRLDCFLLCALQQMVVLSRSTARFVAGNMYQTDQSVLHMANSVTSVEKATILLQSAQEEAVQS